MKILLVANDHQTLPKLSKEEQKRGRQRFYRRMQRTGIMACKAIREGDEVYAVILAQVAWGLARRYRRHQALIKNNPVDPAYELNQK